MRKQVLVLASSPRRGGNSDLLCDAFAQGAREAGHAVEKIYLQEQKIGGCMACYACRKTGVCIQKDDMAALLEKLIAADVIVLATPVYFYSMNGQMKTVIDRTLPRYRDISDKEFYFIAAAASGNMTAFMDRLFYSEFCGNENRAFYMKPAAAVLSARRAGTTAAFDQMNKYFSVQEMPIVSARYWNMVHGARAEDVLQDKEGLYNMRVLARNMAYLLRCQEAAQKAGLPIPEKEPPVFTNFI